MARVTVPVAATRQQMFPYPHYHCWRLARYDLPHINAEALLRDPQGTRVRAEVGAINA